MNQPHPHYEPPKPWLKAPPKEIAICIGIVSLLISLLAPVFQQAQNHARDASCNYQLRQRTTALLQYATDNDNSLPPASQWQSASSSYLMEEKGPCPALSHPAPGVLGYAMDSRLSGRSLERIGAPHNQRILLYESSNLSQNAHDYRHEFRCPPRLRSHLIRRRPQQHTKTRTRRTTGSKRNLRPMNQPKPHDEPPPTAFRQNYVEIYVGVAILGILAAILFPILQKSSRSPTPRPSANRVEAPRP